MAKQRSGAGYHRENDNIEFIEVFSPGDDVSPWPDERPLVDELPDVPSERRHSRRGVITVALVAVVAGAIGIMALNDDNAPDTAATSTIAAIPTTVRLALDPTSAAHYLIDDPALTAYSADIVTPPANGQQVQVWTNGTAIGPIVSIELHPHPYESYGIVGATRDVVDGVELVRPTAQPKTVISEVAIDDAWSATVTAIHMSDAAVVRIVSNVRVVDGELADESSVMEDLRLGLTFEDKSLDTLIFGSVETEVRYLTADGEIATLRSAVGSSEHRLAGFRFITTDRQPFSYGSSHGLLPNGDTIVVWEDEGRLLSLVGPVDPEELRRLSGEARQATESEWSAMLYGLRPDYTLGDFETLATGHATNTELWRAGPQITRRNGRTDFLWWWTVPGLDDVTDSTAASFTVSMRPHVDTLVVPGATYVFVSHPNSGGTITVRTATGVEYVAELLQPFPTQSPIFMTVVRVEEPGPVVVDRDGIEIQQ